MYHLDLKLPVKIEKTIVIGNNRTRLSFFEAELKEVISKNLTIPLLKAELDKVVSRLRSRGLFEYANLDVVLKDVLTDSNSNDNFLADIKITIKEKGIPFIKAETYVKSKTSGSEVGCEVQGALRNIFGCGDVHRISVGTNSSGESKDLLFSSNYPHTISSDQHTGQLDITLKSTEEDNSSFLGFRQITRGLNIDLSSHERHNNKRENKYQIEIADRVEKFLVNTSEPLPKSSSSLISPLFKISSPNLPALQFAMAPDLAKYCRKSLKVSTKYVSTLVDSRDSMISPSKGDYLQTLCEWATPLGDAQFLKTEVTTQIHRSLGPTLFNQPSIVFSMAGSLGCIFPLQNLLFNLKPSSSSTDTSSSSRHDQFINLSDKYHLGGPFSLRGFHIYGIGNRIQPPIMIDNERDESKTVISPNGSALGGTTRCTLVTALSFPFPIPALAKAGARVFVFGNAGGLGNGIYEDNEIKKVSIFLPKPSMQPIFGIMRASVGMGVVIPIATAARLEFTYSMPFLKLSDDFTKQFQVGVGVTIN